MVDFKHTVYKFLSQADDRIKKLSLRVNRSESHLIDGLAEDLSKLKYHTDYFIELLQQVQFNTQFDPHRSINLKNTLQNVLNTLIAAALADRGFIMWSDDGQQLMMGAQYDWEDQSPDHDIALKIIQKTVDEQKTLVTNNFEFNNDPDGLPVPQRTFALRFIVCTPLYVDDNLMGVVYVDIPAKAGQLPTDILHWIAPFNTQSAIAIHNAFLFDRMIDDAARLS